jgi:hypothetical protein
MELHLVLAFDVSASVNDEEFTLQRRGTADALRSETVRDAIKQVEGGIAISIVQWASIGHQVLVLDWAVLRNGEDLERYALATEVMPRKLPGGGTMIHAGLEFAASMFGTAPGHARRKVIDVSGNGQTDDSERLLETRDRLNRDGIVINGLAIEEDHKDLTYYFYRYVVGGPGAFVVTANDHPDFAEAMERKLYLEITGLSVAGKPAPDTTRHAHVQQTDDSLGQELR